MYRNKRILGLICARGGSTGLPGKNLLIFDGKPMIVHAISKLLSLPEIDRVVVSSDSLRIIESAKEFGAEAPFVRPDELSTAAASMPSVVNHCLESLVPDKFDYVVLTQANSPLTLAEDIRQGLLKVVDEDFDVVFSATPCPHPPQWTLSCLDEAVAYAFPGYAGERPKCRQEMEILYRSTGAFSCFSATYFLNSFPAIQLCLPAEKQRTGVVITAHEVSVDIDTLEDFMIAEAIMRYRNEKNIISPPSIGY